MLRDLKAPYRPAPTALVALALALAVAGCAKQGASKETYLATGNKYVADQKYPEAIIEFRNAVQKDAKYGEARWHLAEAYEHEKDAQNAYKEYVNAADLLPDNLPLQVKAADYLLLASRYDDGRAGRAGEPRGPRGIH